MQLQNGPYNSLTVIETTHRFYNGDSRELTFLDDESVNLVVTSPPYPMIEMWDTAFREGSTQIAGALDRGDGWDAFEQMHRLLEPVWEEVARVLTPGGILCLNIGDATRSVGGLFSLYPNHARVLQSLHALGLRSLPAVIWRKPTNSPTKFMGSGMLPVSAYVTLEHEYVLILRKGPSRTFGPQERRRRRESALFWEERNRWYSDLWDLRGTRQALPEGGSRKRSAAYPLELPFRLIHMYSIRGDTVVDPFGGTGTTAVAAAAGGRNSVMVERDLELCESGKGVLEEALPTARERVEQRFREHLEFEARFLEEKGEPLPYRNVSLACGVRTRQERELTLLLPEAGRSKEGRVTVTHEFFS